MWQDIPWVFNVALIVLAVLMGLAAVAVLFLPDRTKRVMDMARKLTVVKVGGNAKDIHVEGNVAEGFDDVSWLESEGNIDGATVKNNRARSGAGPKDKE